MMSSKLFWCDARNDKMSPGSITLTVTFITIREVNEVYEQKKDRAGDLGM